MTDQERKSLAYHESAHATACFVLGGGLGFASIRRTADSLGRCWCDCSDIALQDQLTIDLAGQQAETCLQRGTFIKTPASGASGDWQNIDRSLRRSDCEYQGIVVLEAADRCERLLKKHWPAIKAIAEELLRSEYLSGIEIAELIKKHQPKSW